MKFKEYVENLNKLLEDRPETAGYDVVASGDSVGNCFNEVVYEPSIGERDGRDFETENVEEDEGKVMNAVCIN